MLRLSAKCWVTDNLNPAHADTMFCILIHCYCRITLFMRYFISMNLISLKWSRYGNLAQQLMMLMENISLQVLPKINEPLVVVILPLQSSLPH